MRTSKRFITQSIIIALSMVCFMLTSISAQTGGAINANIAATDAEIQSAAGTVESEQQATGALPMTTEERQWFGQHSLSVNDIAITDLGFERLGLKKSSESQVMTYSESVALPTIVDNSTLKYFPPIRSQGGLGSCVPFSVCYYQLSYYYAKKHNIDQKNNSDNQYKFSPKWIYNLVNGGEDMGSTHPAVYKTIIKHGCPTWEDFPYDGFNYTEWPDNSDVWRNALDYRIEPYLPYVASGQYKPNQFIQKVKELLVNGEVLIFRGYIFSWKTIRIKNDPNTPDDDSEEGKYITYLSDGGDGSHSMNIVGYNDEIWSDINDNGIVDAGEKGAFRVANSWGASDVDDGFKWLAYDAIKAQSEVSGAPVATNRTKGIIDYVFMIIMKQNPEPRLLAEMTLRHGARNEMGFGITYQGCPNGWGWEPHLWGGAHPLDGSNPDRAFTMIFDISSLLEEYLVDDSEAKDWLFHIHDAFPENPLTVESFKLIDVQGNDEVPATINSDVITDGHREYELNYRLKYDNTNYAPMVNAGDDQVLHYPAQTNTWLQGGTTDDHLPNGQSVSTTWTCVVGPETPTISNPTALSTQVTFPRVGRYVFCLTADDSQKQATDYVTVYVSDDFGHTTEFTSRSTSAKRRAMPYTMPEDGMINSITMFHEGGSGDFLLGLYEDLNGLPDSLISVSGYTRVNSSAGWQTVLLPQPEFVAAGTTVWLAWVFESNPGIRWKQGTRGRAQSDGEWGDGMPFAFGASTTTTGEYSIYASFVPVDNIDGDAPTPNPMTWASVPSATGPSSITMTATTASDMSGVEYYFECVSGGGNNSGWQASPSYTDNGLQPATQYTYRVKARDLSSNRNETNWSSQRSTNTGISNDVNFGHTGVYSKTSTSPSRRAQPVTMPENGTINSITIYHEGGSGDLILGLYDGNSAPASRLGYTVQTALRSSAGWQTLQLITPVEVSSGTQLWLAWLFESNPGIRYQSGTPGRAASSQSWSGGMPNPFGSSSSSNYIYSIYASYTPGGGPVDPDPPTPNPLTWASVPVATGTSSITMTATTATDMSGVEYYFECLTSGGHNSGWQSSPSYTDNGLQEGTLYTYRVKARDLSANQNEGSWSSQQSAETEQSGTDLDVGHTSVYTKTSTSPSRRAQPVTMSEDGTIHSISIYHEGGSGDLILAVYDGNSAPANRLGYTSSATINSTAGWQTLELINSVPVSSGTQLWLAWVFQSNPGIKYQNGTPGRAASSANWSGGMPATFGSSSSGNYVYSIYATYTPGGGPVDNTPPNPDPMTWASVPSAVSTSSVTMTATTASDVSGVEYMFECVWGGGNNSGWQSSPTYTDQGLQPSTMYTYQVKARDLSANLNETELSVQASATTPAASSDVELLGSFAQGSSHAVQSGSNRVLLLFAHVEHNGADVHATSVTYGGQPMTQVMESNEGSGYRAFTGVYMLDEAGIAAASGSSFSVNWNVSTSRAPTLSHVFLENVNQSSPVGMIAENGGTTPTVSTSNLSTSSGDMVLVAATCGAGGSYSVNNGFTEGIEATVESGDGVVGYKKANGASEQASVTHSAVNRQSVIGLVIKK